MRSSTATRFGCSSLVMPLPPTPATRSRAHGAAWAPSPPRSSAAVSPTRAWVSCTVAEGNGNGSVRRRCIPTTPAAAAPTPQPRRTQALVERQLRLIEQLENKEEDPEALAELFQLDHLATRMRRNSENLLVLSGTDVARPGGRPVPLGAE